MHANQSFAIDSLAEECNVAAIQKGFYNEYDGLEGSNSPLTVAQSTFVRKLWLNSRLMLIVSELAEACEELRNTNHGLEVYYKNGSNKPEGFGIELADAVICLLDLMYSITDTPSSLIHTKMEYNKTRPNRHGGRAL